MCFEAEPVAPTSAANDKPEIDVKARIRAIPADVMLMLLDSRVYVDDTKVAAALLHALSTKYVLDMNTGNDGKEAAIALSVGEYYRIMDMPEEDRDDVLAMLEKRATELEEDIAEDIILLDWMNRLHQ
jgi:hypothetical protein